MLAGPNAVLSGLFFDPPSARRHATPTATAIASSRQDTTTQGNWIGAYGSQGYDIIGNAASYPAYATVTPAGQSTYTWAASTTDPGPENAGGTGRIAAGWYAGTSFTVDVNLTDGQAHDLALYCSTGTTRGGASRSRSATPPPGRCWTPRRSRRSPGSSTSTGRSAGTW